MEHALTVRMFLFGMTPAQFRIIAPSKDGKSGTGIRGWSDSRWLAAGGAGSFPGWGYWRLATKTISCGVSFLANSFSTGEVGSWRPLVSPADHTWERK